MLATIAICTWNRAALLRRALEAIERLQVPEGIHLEILVCDNNSTDATPAVVREFQERLPVRRLFEPAQGKPNALARLIREARGDWVFFLDDDVTVHQDWLVGYCDGIRRYPEAAFFGGQIVPSLDTKLSWVGDFVLKQVPWVCGVMLAANDSPLTAASHLTTAGGNMAFRRDAIPVTEVCEHLESLGAQTVGEDTWLMLNQLSRGQTGWFLAAPKVAHHVPPERAGLVWFWKWNLARGKTIRLAAPGGGGEQDLRRWIVKRRLARLWETARTLDVLQFLWALMSSGAFIAGFLTARKRSSR